MFTYTWRCYDYFKEYVTSALLSASVTELTAMRYECNGWVAEDPVRWLNHSSSYSSRYVTEDRSINYALREIGYNCSFYDYRRDFYDEYAKKRGFAGGESNRCLQNFIVRSNSYNEEAFRTFLTEMHKYLVQDISLYGILLSFTRANGTECNRRKAWVRENIAVLSEQLLSAREVFKEAPADVTSTNQTRLTSEDFEGIVTNVMHESDIDQLLWKERISRYGGLIKKIVDDLKREYSNFSSEGSIEGVMYLPYAHEDRRYYYVLKLPESENETAFYERKGYKGANIFVSWTGSPYPSDVLNSRIALIRSHESAVWDAIFGEKAGDLCKNMRTAASDHKLISLKDSSDRSEFNAVVAIRCAYEFVWYELGWRYYETAATTSDYVLSRHAGEYKKACGQLIFLP